MLVKFSFILKIHILPAKKKKKKKKKCLDGRMILKLQKHPNFVFYFPYKPISMLLEASQNS